MSRITLSLKETGTRGHLQARSAPGDVSGEIMFITSNNNDDSSDITLSPGETGTRGYLEARSVPATVTGPTLFITSNNGGSSELERV